MQFLERPLNISLDPSRKRIEFLTSRAWEISPFVQALETLQFGLQLSLGFLLQEDDCPIRAKTYDRVARRGHAYYHTYTRLHGGREEELIRLRRQQQLNSSMSSEPHAACRMQHRSSSPSRLRSCNRGGELLRREKSDVEIFPR